MTYRLTRRPRKEGGLVDGRSLAGSETLQSPRSRATEAARALTHDRARRVAAALREANRKTDLFGH
jgi:hypothetical protein